MIETKQKIMMLDTETTNGIDDPIVYDVGFEVFDLTGRVFERGSFINQDVFKDAELMASAYYAEKIPIYLDQIAKGESVLLPWCMIKWKIYDVCERHGIKIIAAHNARFDSKAVNYTQRYITSSQFRYFLKYDMEWWDTLKMAREVLKDDPEYKAFCKANGFMTSRNQCRFTAEVIYRFIYGDLSFEEAHRGLDDVKIEREIFRYCLAVKPDIDGRLYTKPYEPKGNEWHKKWWDTGV